MSVFVELFLRGEELKERALEMAERRRTEEEMKRRAEFEQHLLGIVSHDVRTPLSTILASARYQLGKQELPADIRKAFERIERSGNRIRDMIDLLLDFTRARLGNGIPVLRGKMDLHELCRHAVEEVSAVNPERKLQLRLDLDQPEGEWDSNRLHQVLTNLLDNARKYGAADAPITVRTYAAGPDSVGIEVHNFGPKIPDHVLPKMFEPFEAGDLGQHRSSLGLGLFIARKIVEAHGGAIGVRSSEDAGTAFCITLPRMADAKQPVTSC